LVDGGGAPVDGTPDEVGVVLFELARAHDVSIDYPIRKSRGETFDLTLYTPGHRLKLPSGPRTRDPFLPRVATDLPGHVGVTPQGFGAWRRAMGVGGGHLPGEHKR
jgi:hypothetical protein